MSIEFTNIDKDFICSELEKLSVPGISLCIRTEAEFYSFSNGYADIIKKQPITQSSIFNIASIGKLITSSLIFKLQEEKKLYLDCLISAFIQCPPHWSQITIRHLITHTSGLPDYTSTAAYWNEVQLDVSKNRVLEYIINENLQFIPGSRWDYSNTGYFLLGLIIEQLTGEDYFTFTGKSLLSNFPAIIKTENSVVERNVVGYETRNGEFVEAAYYSNSGTFAAGGFSASPIEFLRLENYIFQNVCYLNSTSINELLSPFVFNNGQDFSTIHPELNFEVCHGLYKFSRNGVSLYAHSGSIKGFSSVFIKSLHLDMSMIIAVNTEDYSDTLLNLLFKIHDYFLNNKKSTAS